MAGMYEKCIQVLRNKVEKEIIHLLPLEGITAFSVVPVYRLQRIGVEFCSAD